MSHDAAARFFAKKTPLSSAAFEKLSKENRARAFRIAGLHKVNLVQRARDVVHRGIRDGTPWPDIRRELAAIFETGKVPTPSLARLRTMFRQNTLHAYNAARVQVLDDPEMKLFFPFRQYLTVGNGSAGVNNVRTTHAALHGKVFRADDPFWGLFTPPWEWG